jgi:flagella basal body P-ring formation protein FlgA
MKRASNSLLTLYQIPFTAHASVPALPRVKTGTNRRRFTPFTFYWRNGWHRSSVLPGLSCSPRSFVRSWLGEGRIRSLLRGTGSALLAVSMLIAFVQSATGADGVVIHLKEEASVRSATIVLKDVAEVRGPDAKRVEQLSQIALGPAPEFGSVAILNRHQISRLLQAAAGPLSGGLFSGATAVSIRAEGKALNPQDVAPLLKAYIQENSPWKESEIEVRSIEHLNGIELPPGGAELHFSAGDPVVGHSSILAPLEITQEGRTLRSSWIRAEIAVTAKILVAAQRITPGKIVRENDFITKSMPITDLRGDYARSLDEVVGKAAGRSFSPGDPIFCEAFKNPVLVKSGETVQLRLDRKGIALTSQARAEEDGSLGQVIRVRNLDFSAVLKARVTGRSQVTVQ